MKIQSPANVRQRENGSATIIFITLLGVMLILVTAEMRSLAQLRSETKWLEKQQVKRLNHSATNLVAVTNPESK